MKKILIPFDFTDVCRNALKYAFFAFTENSEFLILHVVDGHLDLNDPLTYREGMTRIDALAKEMEDIAQELLQESGLKAEFESKVLIGGIVENLVKTAEKIDFDAVVMGTRDKYDIFDKLFGTVSLGVVKRVEMPVLLIPNGCEFSSYDRIVIGADYHLESDRVLEMLMEWNSDYQADLRFLHLIDGKGKEEEFAINIVEEFFEKRSLPFPFAIIQKDGKHIAHEIIDYADEEDMDLQILITDKMSWLDTITSKSVSKTLIQKATKPIMFIHSGARKRSQLFFHTLTINA